MNISCRIANADTQCGQITNPPEREFYLKYTVKSRKIEWPLKKKSKNFKIKFINMKIISKLTSISFLLLILSCTTQMTSIMPSNQHYSMVVNYQIDLEQSFYGWTDENGYILVPNNDLMKCIKISHNGVEYELGVSNNHIIKYIATTDKRFSVEGYKIGDEIYKTHTIIGWGNYAKINEEWYAAWFTENKNERSGKIQWFFKFDFR